MLLAEQMNELMNELPFINQMKSNKNFYRG